MNAASTGRSNKSTGGGWFRRCRRSCVWLLLAGSLLINGYQYQQLRLYYLYQSPPRESFHSGSTTASERILLLRVRGTIMPPFTERIIRSIKRAAEDDRVRGVMLSIDSPGGFVADSHQIYRELQKLGESKPIYVSMRRMAASGGYYIAMGSGMEGKIFAEPTCWTGSIGVIIPRWDVSEMATKIGVKTDSLKTGPYKDTLNPMSELTPDERELWDAILSESYEQFVDVIADNRPLTRDDVKTLATGQIYTAKQALENGLIDEIAFEDEALEKLKQQLDLADVRVVTYDFAPSWYDIVFQYVQAKEPPNVWQMAMESTVPQALYFTSWTPGLPYQFQATDD